MSGFSPLPGFSTTIATRPSQSSLALVKEETASFYARFIALTGEVIMQMPYSVIEKTVKTLNARRKTISGAKVLILGIAYQKDIGDLRESPALTIIELLRRRGAEVSYNDPYFPFLGHGRHYDLNLTCAPLDHLGRYDCVLIITDHSGYDYTRIARESRLVIDISNATRNISFPNVVHC